MESNIDINKIAEYKEYIKYKSEVEVSKIELEKEKNNFADSIRNSFKKELKEHFEMEKAPKSKIKTFFRKIFKKNE